MYGNIVKEESIKIPNVTCRKTKLVIELCRVIAFLNKIFYEEIICESLFQINL